MDRRQTLVKSHQLPDLFDGLDKLEETAFTDGGKKAKDYIMLLLFTGLRKLEAAKLTWDHVDFRDKTFTVPDTKNKRPLTLPMSDFVHDLLNERRESRGEDDVFVFPADSREGHLTDPKRQLAKLNKLSGLSLSLHDLRRTFITIAESLDISQYAIKRLVNHTVAGDVTSGYIIADAERLRIPMQTIADAILIRAKRKGQADVIPFVKPLKAGSV